MTIETSLELELGTICLSGSKKKLVSRDPDIIASEYAFNA
jgi:hypothetical protein